MESNKQNTQEIEMNELDIIMEQFIDAEYGLVALLTILNALEIHYEYTDNKELHALVFAILRYLESIQSDISKTITKMDLYILESK